MASGRSRQARTPVEYHGSAREVEYTPPPPPDPSTATGVGLLAAADEPASGRQAGA